VRDIGNRKGENATRARKVSRVSYRSVTREIDAEKTFPSDLAAMFRQFRSPPFVLSIANLAISSHPFGIFARIYDTRTEIESSIAPLDLARVSLVRRYRRFLSRGLSFRYLGRIFGRLRGDLRNPRRAARSERGMTEIGLPWTTVSRSPQTLSYLFSLIERVKM